MHAAGAIAKCHRASSPSSGSSLVSYSSSRSASRGGLPPCKTARHFTQPSVSASATATPSSVVETLAAVLESTPSALSLDVASSSSITALSTQ